MNAACGKNQGVRYGGFHKLVLVSVIGSLLVGCGGADSLVGSPETLVEAQDTLVEAQDTLVEAQDTLAVNGYQIGPKADLVDANLAGALLQMENLAGANLAGARMNYVRLTGTIFDKTIHG